MSAHSVKRDISKTDYDLPGRCPTAARTLEMSSGTRRALLTVLLLLSGHLAGALAADAAGQDADSLSPATIAEEYKIRMGDELGIKFFFSPDLNEEVVVRPDGRISLQLIPETVAAGKTPAELSAELQELYSTALDRPAISVLVRSFSAQRIYVDGEVKKPGELALVESLTVLQAIAAAAGFDKGARLKRVFVIRRGPDGQPLILPLNLARAREGTDPSQDILLQPYDVVYVPRSRIANVNKWVDQYVRQNIPFSFGFRLEVQ